MLNDAIATIESHVKAKRRRPDFTVENHLSILILYPRTRRANAWLDANVANPETQWFAGGLVVEPRYMADLLAGIDGDGLTIG